MLKSTRNKHEFVRQWVDRGAKIREVLEADGSRRGRLLRRIPQCNQRQKVLIDAPAKITTTRRTYSTDAPLVANAPGKPSETQPKYSPE